MIILQAVLVGERMPEPRYLLCLAMILSGTYYLENHSYFFYVVRRFDVSNGC